MLDTNLRRSEMGLGTSRGCQDVGSFQMVNNQASQKGAADAKRGALFTKLARNIIIGSLRKAVAATPI